MSHLVPSMEVEDPQHSHLFPLVQHLQRGINKGILNYNSWQYVVPGVPNWVDGYNGYRFILIIVQVYSIGHLIEWICSPTWVHIYAYLLHPDNSAYIQYWFVTPQSLEHPIGWICSPIWVHMLTCFILIMMHVHRVGL